MPYLYEKILVERNEIVGFKCDCCGDAYNFSENALDDFEFQELVKVDFVGGYGSVFGDGAHVCGVFCQRCIDRLLGEYLVVESDDGYDS